MVYYDDKKNRRHASLVQNDSGTTRFEQLPSEILINILGRLEARDIGNTRLTCTSWTPVCNTILQDRLKVLYLHPTTTSIRKFIAICTHPVFSQRIEEISLIGMYAVPYDRLDKNAHLTKRSLPFDIWPESFPPCPRMPGERPGSAAEDRTSTRELLLGSLQHLPNLNALTLESKVRRPGFNQISEAAVKSYTRNRRQYAHTPGAVHLVQKRRSLQSPYSLSSFDLVIAILRSRPFAQISVRDRMYDQWLEHCQGVDFQRLSMQVLSALAGQDAIKARLSSSFPFPGWSGALSSLTDISLNILTIAGITTQRQEWRGFCREAIRGACALESLSLTIEIPRLIRKDLSRSYRDSVIAQVLRFDETLPRLRKFCISIRADEPQGVISKPHKRDPQPNSYYMQSPAAGVFVDAAAYIPEDVEAPPMLEFLRRHADNLETVRIINYHASMSHDRFYSPHHLSLTCDMIRMLKRAPKLLDFSWQMRRCFHHAWCRRAFDDPDRSQCPMSCDRYTDYVTAGSYKALAIRMGVQFDEESQSWDFATGKWLPPHDI